MPPFGNSKNDTCLDSVRTGNTSLLRIIVCSYFAVFFGHNLWRYTFYNYALEDIGLRQEEIVWYFSLASIPGIFTFLLGYVARQIALYILATAVLLLFSAGILILGIAKDTSGLVPGIVMLSIGVSWYLPIVNHICIAESASEVVNRNMGLLKSMGPFAAVFTTVLIYIYSRDGHIENLFILAGLVLMLTAAIVGLSLRRYAFARTHTGMHFSRNLWPYYVLNFISGSRSALFKTFIITQFVFTLEFSVVEMSVLMLAGSVMGICGYRLLGYLAGKYQAVNVLSTVYIMVAGVLVGFVYALQAGESAKLIACFLFLFDSLLMGSAVVTDSYLKRADNEMYVVSDIAFGATFFSLAGVLVPVAGSYFLSHLGGLNSVLGMGIFIAVLGAFVSRFMLVLPHHSSAR